MGARWKWILVLALLAGRLSAQTVDWSWAQAMGNEQYDLGRSVAVASDGSIYQIIFTASSSLLVGDSLFTFDGGTTVYRSILSKRSSDGTPVWARSFTGTGGNYMSAIALDQDENVVIGGSFTGTFARLGNFELDGGSSVFDHNLFVAKVNGSGTCISAYTLDAGLHSISINDLAVDGDNNIVASGKTVADLSIVGSHCQNSSFEYDRPFLLKIDADCNALWGKCCSDGFSWGDVSVAVDQQGNSYMVGPYAGSYIRFDQQAIDITASNSDVNSFVFKFDPMGNCIWGKSINGSGQDFLNTVEVDPLSRVVIAGRTRSSSIQVSGQVVPIAGYDAGFVTRLDADGTMEWCTVLGGSTWVSAMSADIPNAIVIAGYFTGPDLVIGESTLTNAGAGVGFLGFLGAAGEGLRAEPLSSEMTYVDGLAMGPNDVVVLSGAFSGSPIQIGSISLPMPFPDGTYMDAFLCSAHVSEVPTAVNELAQNKLVLQPNPATDRVYINFTMGEEPVVFELLDESGRVSKRMTIRDPLVDVSDVAPGMYLVRITNGAEVRFAKLALVK